MITKKTFATMIVPSMAPTCRYAARAENRCVTPYAVPVTSTSMQAASAASLRFATVRQSASYTNHAATSRPIDAPIASASESFATLGSIRYVCGCR